MNEQQNNLSNESMQWQPMDTAPKDVEVFLDIGARWPVVGVFNPANNDWVYPYLLILLSQSHEGGYVYKYDRQHAKDPKGWMKLPEVNQ